MIAPDSTFPSRFDCEPRSAFPNSSAPHEQTHCPYCSLQFTVQPIPQRFGWSYETGTLAREGIEFEHSGVWGHDNGAIRFALGAVAVFPLASCSSINVAECAPPVECHVRPSAACAEGRQIYLTTCTKCHSVEPIRDHSLTDWQSDLMPTMAKKAKLTPQQSEAVFQYDRTVLASPPPPPSATPQNKAWGEMHALLAGFTPVPRIRICTGFEWRAVSGATALTPSVFDSRSAIFPAIVKV